VTGAVKLKNDNGKIAYYFDKTSSIRSEEEVNSFFTFVIIYRRLEPAGVGRFFTSSVANRMFASHQATITVWHNEAWIRHPGYNADTGIEFQVGINNNNLKDQFDFRRMEKQVDKSTAGVNAWGKVVIGKPQSDYSSESAEVFVYEAIAFNRVLNADELTTIKNVFRAIYF